MLWRRRSDPRYRAGTPELGPWHPGYPCVSTGGGPLYAFNSLPVPRSAWVLGVGGLLMLWYSARVVLLSFFGGRWVLCRSCDSGARKWSRAVLKLAGVSVRVEGVENLALDGAFIIVANHESWFDVWALAGCLPIDARFVAKKELERVPLFGHAWKACGHISIDRGDRATAIGVPDPGRPADRGGGPPDGALRGRDPMPGWGAPPLQEGPVRDGDRGRCAHRSGRLGGKPADHAQGILPDTPRSHDRSCR